MHKKLDKIIRYPEKIPCDKRLHMFIGVILVSILTIFTINVWVVSISLVSLAWGIEIFQKITKSGTYDNYDALVVVVGGLIVYVSRLVG